MKPYLVATCDRERLGWPHNETTERLPDACAKQPDPARKKALAEEAQKYNLEIVTHVPLGEWFGVAAVGKNVVAPKEAPPVTVFWGMGKR